MSSSVIVCYCEQYEQEKLKWGDLHVAWNGQTLERVGGLLKGGSLMSSTTSRHTICSLTSSTFFFVIFPFYLIENTSMYRPDN
jgi:hypothetical protein